MPRADSVTRKLYAVAPKPRPGPIRKRQDAKRPGPRGVEYRKVVATGSSLAVTLAPACLRLLRARRGSTVQVHAHPSGKVIIAPMRMRLGATSELVAAVKEVVYLRRLVAKQRKRLIAMPVAAVSRGFGQGYMKAVNSYLHDLDNRVDTLAKHIEGLTRVLSELEPLPSPAPPPASIEGGDVASGGHPPGHPTES